MKQPPKGTLHRPDVIVIPNTAAGRYVLHLAVERSQKAQRKGAA